MAVLEQNGGRPVRFGVYELDTRGGVLRKNGAKIRLQEQPLQILTLLLERPGKIVTREEICRKLWPDGTFVDFDHSLNAAVMRLREALDDSADNPRFIETVPRRGYRFLDAMNRLDAVAVASAAQPRHLTSFAGRWWVLWSASLAVTAALALAVWLHKTGQPPPPTARIKASLAVLPFENLSADAGNEYFSDGMTEEIIGKLSRISGLQVAARTSVARFKGTQRDIREIARESNVRYLLVGGVRKAGTRVRISVQLVDSTSGFQRWADDFEVELIDVFTVQEQTALKIAEALDQQLSDEEQQRVSRRPTQNPEAYDAYLRGRALASQFNNRERLQSARSQFERALQADPEYALALAGLAEVEAQYCRNFELSEGCLQRAEELATRALARDPNIAAPHVALARVYGGRYDYARAERELSRAIELDPNDPLAWILLAWARSYKQPAEALEAEAAAREAIRLAFTLPGGYYQLGRALTLQGRYGEAIAAFEHALRLDPDFDAPHVGLAQTYLAQGKYQQALEELDEWGNFRKTPHVVFQRSLVHAAQGQREKALKELERALAGGYRDFAAIDASPYLLSLRSEARFRQLIRRYRK